MALEVLQGKIYVHTAGIYSLGLAIYRLLNKEQLPFLSENIFSSDLDMQRVILGWLNERKERQQPCDPSEKLKKIILKICAYDLEKRYQSASEILTELEKIMKTDEINIIISETLKLERNTKEKMAYSTKAVIQYKSS